MVTIPTPQAQGAAVGSVQQSGVDTPFINVTPANTGDALARDMATGAQALSNLANNLNERRNDNAMQEAVVAYNEFEKGILNPQTGIFTRRMGNAAGVTADVQSQFAAFRDGTLANYGQGLSSSGRQALEEYLGGAEQRLWKRAAAHELDQSYAHEQELIGAQIEGQVDRASFLYNDPEEVSAAAFQIESLAGDLADSRGLQGEARASFVEGQISAMHTQVASQMATAGDATGALAYVETMMAEGTMDRSDGAAVTARLRPLAVEQQGNAFAQAAFTGASGPPGSTPGGQPTVATIMPALFAQESGYGAGRSEADAINITSSAGAKGIAQSMPGTESDPGYGVRPYAYAGGVPAGVSQEMVAREQKRFGQDYLSALVRNYNGNMTHALYAYNWGPGNVDKWLRTGTGVNGQPMPQETANYAPSVLRRAGYSMRPSANMDEPGVQVTNEMTAQERIAAIEDPEVRAAAATELERMQALDYRQHNRVQGQTANDIYSQIEQAALGNADFDLDQYFRNNPGAVEALGDQLGNIRSFYKDRGEPETDERRFSDLQIMSEARPEQFAQEDLWRYKAELSPQDFRSFVNKQAQILGDTEAPDVNRVTLSDMRSNIGAVTTGLDTADRGFVERGVQDFITAYTAQSGSPPSAIAQSAQAERLSAEMRNKKATGFVEDLGTGIFNFAQGDVEGIFNEVDQEGLPALFARDDLAFNIEGAGGVMERRTIDPETLRNFSYNYERQTGRAPRPSQVLQMVFLIESGLLP